MQKNPIVLALDNFDNVEQLEQLHPLIKTLAPHVGMFKVGLELMTRFGALQIVDFVHNLGGRVFLDGKFHDIPNTVGQAAKAVAALGVEMFTVHAVSGREALQVAAAAKGKSKMLVVTVLTSLKPADLWNMYFPPETPLPPNSSSYIPGVVEVMAQIAQTVGADGVICSPKELAQLSSLKLLKVTPGVRPAWADMNDQKRVMTPAEAIQAGADHIVIGRPITQAKDRTPLQALQDILREIAEATE